MFAFDELLAIGGPQAARRRGLLVPEQLLVVGFDDTFEP
jgi:DNA-binding LacI/PurR family transcriptional regulator